MLSPKDAKTRMGERMFRKSSRRPFRTMPPLVILLPTNSSSVMASISSPFSRKKPLHHFSNSRYLSASVSMEAYRLYAFFQ
ncbi:hypothetical protein D3C71_1970240 [compost metagenome]